MKMFSELNQLGFFKWVNEVDSTYLMPTSEKIAEMDNEPPNSLLMVMVNALAIKFFREKVSLIFTPVTWYVENVQNEKPKLKWAYSHIYYLNNSQNNSPYSNEVLFSNFEKFNHYFEAEVSCIKKMIELAKTLDAYKKGTL